MQLITLADAVSPSANFKNPFLLDLHVSSTSVGHETRGEYPMKRLFAITALLTGLWCGTANAQFVSNDVSPRSIGPITIAISDDATSACWTNLREVREYTEEKLRMSRYSVVQNAGDYSHQGFYFHIEVIGVRTNGMCDGMVSVELVDYMSNASGFGWFTMGAHNVLTTNYNNLNNSVITAVQDFIDEM